MYYFYELIFKYLNKIDILIQKSPSLLFWNFKYIFFNIVYYFYELIFNI